MRRTASCLARAMRGAAQRAGGVSPPLRPGAPNRAFAAASTDDTSSPSAWRPAPLEPVTSAYVHLPFCRRRCYYCDFAISVVGDAVESDAVRQGMEAYVDRVCREIGNTPFAPSTAAAAGDEKDWPLRTVFFGGGTPSLVPPDLLRRVLDALRSKFGLAPDAEVSMEMDPGTFDRAKLDGYLRSGVTRVSLGVQSFDADVLKLAGRAHTAQDARAACAAVAEAMRDAQKREDEAHSRRESASAFGRDDDTKKCFSWSLDLIGGLPGLTRDAWRASLAEAVFFKPDHVSVYDLQIEEGTPFHKWYEPGEGVMPDEETGAAMFRDAAYVLRDAGFEHYEVSSYAKPGKRCRHNQVYWNSGRQGWYAFGMAATSHVDAAGERVARPRKMRDWESWVDAMPPFRVRAEVMEDVAKKTFTETETAELRASALMERLMLGLRTRDGIDLDALASEFGVHVPGEILGVLAEQPAGLAVVATRDGEEERDAAAAEVSYSPKKSARVSDDDRNAGGSGTVVRLTDPEGLMVSTEVISTLVARLPSLEKL